MPETRFARLITITVLTAAVAVVAVLVVVALRGTGDTTPAGTPLYTEPPTPDVTRPKVNAYFIGDSVTLSSATGGPATGFAGIICQRFQWSCEYDGIGSTGYVARGEEAKDNPDTDVDKSFSARLQQIVDSDPDVVVVAGGRNEQATSLATVEPAAEAFLGSLRDALPEARIVVISGFLWDVSPDAQWREGQDQLSRVLEQQAAEIGATFVNPYGLIRIDDGNVATMAGADGWHPSRAGAIELGDALAVKLRDAGLPLGPENWTYDFHQGEWRDATEAGVLGL